MKILSALTLSFLSVSALATAPQLPAPRVSLFSTSVDWAAVTGRPWQQYTGQISGGNKSLLKNGLVLYYLDTFPCYGEADSVRVWVSPRGEMNGHLRLVCVAAPKTISFAYRNADQEALDARTTGILNCSTTGDRYFKIDLLKCEIGPKWTEYK